MFYLYHVISSSKKPSEVGAITTSILEKKITKQREVKSFAQGHTACKLLNGDSNL